MNEVKAIENPENNRFDCEGDEMVRGLFSPVDLQLSPEEYAARHGHQWGCFSFHRFRYRDPVLGKWVRRLGEILFDQEELERCRHRFLTAKELARVQEEEKEGF